MFDGTYDQPHNHKELKDAARKAARNLGACIDAIVDLIDFHAEPGGIHIEDSEAARRFSEELIRLTAYVIRADAALEEMHSRLFLIATGRNTDDYNYFEALSLMGYEQKYIDIVADLRRFRNMVGHSLSLRKSLASAGMDKKLRGYLLYLKPAVRDLLKEARTAYAAAVEDLGGWEAFVRLRDEVVAKERQRRKEERRKLQQEALAIEEDIDLPCADAETAFGAIYDMVRDDEKVVAAPAATVVETIRMLVAAGCALQRLGESPTFNAAVAEMVTLPTLARLVRRADAWDLSGFAPLFETYGLRKKGKRIRRPKIAQYRALHYPVLRLVVAAAARAVRETKNAA